jgi:alpha-tubulin suppressor-like RCC1 family protein
MKTRLLLILLSAALMLQLTPFMASTASAAKVTPMVVAGANRSLALKDDGTVWAWGRNYYGQLGDGTYNDSSTPVEVKVKDNDGTLVPLTGVTALAAGATHSLALKNDGTVFAWGDNELGQLGDGTKGDYASSHTPVKVAGLSDVKAIAAGYPHSLALKNDGTVFAWGRNRSGELGDGTNANKNTPVQVKGKDGAGYLTDVTAIVGRGWHSMALKNDGTVFAWGDNEFGQLGDGTNANRNTPVQVKGKDGAGYLSDVKAITLGFSHSLALKNDGTALAWGNNEFGQLGDGTSGYYASSPTPVKVLGLTDVKAIAAGYHYYLALKNDGTLLAWGDNNHGELGDGTNANKNTPVQVKGKDGAGYLTDVKAIAGGYHHSIALKNDGTVWSGGNNDHGQLGDGTHNDSTTPVKVKGKGGSGYLDLGSTAKILRSER